MRRRGAATAEAVATEPMEDFAVPASGDEAPVKVEQHRNPIKLKNAKIRQNVFRLRAKGILLPDIARKLKIEPHEAARYLKQAFEEYYAQNDDVVREITATNHARLEKLFSVWGPKAFGGRDPKAAKIALDIIAELQTFVGARRVKVEHSGPNGGPIRIEDVSKLNDDQIQELREGKVPGSFLLPASSGRGRGRIPPEGTGAG